MSTVREWRTAVLSAYESSPVTVLKADQVGAPDNEGVVVIKLGESAVSATQTLIGALKPRLAILTTGDDEEEGFEVHLVSDSWLCVVYLDPESADGTPDGVPVANDVARHILDEAVDQLAAADLPIDHTGVERVCDALMQQLAEGHPELAAGIRHAVGPSFFDYATDLSERLRDRHRATFRNNAHEFAARILAEESVRKGTTRPLLRDIVYRYMKRVDPGCVTRASVELIVLELDLQLKLA